MRDFKTTITINGKTHQTLSDILPIPVTKLEILFIAKTPTPVSVKVGHYFQGHHGKMFWNRLNQYEILKPQATGFEDESLISNKFGLTDIVKYQKFIMMSPPLKSIKTGLLEF